MRMTPRRSKLLRRRSPNQFVVRPAVSDSKPTTQPAAPPRPAYMSKKAHAEDKGIGLRFQDELIARGIFRAVKLGDRVLLDVAYNDNVMQNLPPAALKAREKRDSPLKRGRGRPRKHVLTAAE